MQRQTTPANCKMFLAAVGKHKIQLTVGDAHTNQGADFVVGKITEKKVVLGAGAIKVTAVFSQGREAVAEGATFELRKGKADLDGTFSLLSTLYASPSRFSAPAGSYQIVAQMDYATAIEKLNFPPGSSQNSL